jgi:Family of unknown function (DUF6064)
MSEWLTYSLSDLLLFAPSTYYRLFELYNLALWPAHLVPLAFGVAILFLVRRGGEREGRAVAAILAACWLWVAWAWFMERYATINWAASYFAAGFAVEALLLLWTGAVRGRLVFRAGPDAIGRIGTGIFVFALAAQPLIGPLLAGRAWTQAEVFGMAPDPTAVATLGLLLTAAGGAVGPMVVPLLWCAAGGATLWTMGAPDALVMPAAAVVAVLLSAWKGLSRTRRA